MKNNSEFEVTSADTLLPFLLASFSGKSRNYVKGLLRRGQITVDGRSCTDYARPLAPGTRVCVLKDAPAGDELGFPVIYEDDDIIVIDKPAGMLAVSTDSVQEYTAFYIVNEYLSSRNRAGRAFIVHRLDRDTSGVMLLAKNERVKLALQEDWNESVIRRGYVALVEGQVTEPSGTIRSWLKQTKTFMVYSSGREGDGKLAITSYKTRRVSEHYSLLDISLETGRKNQIRVHMKEMGHPVAGDKKYGATTNPLGRLGLHASELSLKHPVTGETMRFEASTPPAFLKKM